MGKIRYEDIRQRRHRNEPADGKTAKELVTQALALGDSRETTILDLLGVQLEGVVGELEALLDESRELADATALLAEDFLGVGCADDDLHRRCIGFLFWGEARSKAHLRAGVGHANVATRVALLRELAGEEIVQLGAEDTVSDELALLADLAGHLESGREAGQSVG